MSSSKFTMETQLTMNNNNKPVTYLTESFHLLMLPQNDNINKFQYQIISTQEAERLCSYAINVENFVPALFSKAPAYLIHKLFKEVNPSFIYERKLINAVGVKLEEEDTLITIKLYPKRWNDPITGAYLYADDLIFYKINMITSKDVPELK